MSFVHAILGSGMESTLARSVILLLVALAPRTAPAQHTGQPGKQLQVAASDSSRAAQLANASFDLVKSHPDSAKLLGRQAMLLARRSGSAHVRAMAHNSLGWLAVQQGAFDSAQWHLDSALFLFRQLERPKEINAVLNNLGWLAQYRGDLVTALGRFKEALALSEAESDTSSSAVLLYAIGTIYNSLNEPGPAREYMSLALGLEQQLGRIGKQGICLMGMANSWAREDREEEAAPLYQQAGALFEQAGDTRNQGRVEENLGSLYSTDNPARAIRHLERAADLYASIGSEPDMAYIMNALGETEMGVGRFDRARKHFEVGLAIARRLGVMDLVMTMTRNHAKLAAARGNGQAAINWYERYVQLKDSLRGADMQQELARLRTAFETERKEKDNELLRARNSEQAQKLRARNLQFYGSVVIGLLALAGMILLAWNLRQKRRHMRVLDDLNHRLAASNKEVNEVNDLLEMKVLRSQMNPHFIFNCLNSAASMTHEGRNQEALAYLQRFAGLLRTVLDHGVSDRVTVEEEVRFLEEYLAIESQRLGGLQYTITVSDELREADAELPALILQPFVENAVWHGLSAKDGERRLEIDLGIEGGDIVCMITDNGIGRKANMPKDAHRSVGMQLTGQRVRLLARQMKRPGAIEVEDLKDELGHASGTRVRLRFPKEQDNEAPG